jgi:hypothetical protein
MWSVNPVSPTQRFMVWVPRECILQHAQKRSSGSLSRQAPCRDIGACTRATGNPSSRDSVWKHTDP